MKTTGFILSMKRRWAPLLRPSSLTVKMIISYFSRLYKNKIQKLEDTLESLTTTMKGWQIASKVEAALYEHICQTELPLDQLALMKSPSAALFFYTVDRCERRRRRGLSLVPSDATDFYIWNTHLKTRWEVIVKAVKAKKEYWGTLRLPSAHLSTVAGDYDAFVISLQLPPAQQALLTRARTDMLSFM
ncbi:hypothetical protein ARMGADRAFT_235470 [Armillaria gallica]|uniref:Uncharacterized protein n=1 Tax=Armillaria gallica TaxID=47427 RepID=A0A2H3EGG2_ARMGA|nr:hypothetical protein ARMGADRAFT_235470 [Armillaria gallica]